MIYCSRSRCFGCSRLFEGYRGTACRLWCKCRRYIENVSVSDMTRNVWEDRVVDCTYVWRVITFVA